MTTPNADYALHAQPHDGSVWVEEVVHAICRNCGRPLRRHHDRPGILGGITWYHPHNSYKRHNGYECDPIPAQIDSSGVRP